MYIPLYGSSDSAYAIPTLASTILVSRWVCDAALWQQTLLFSSWSVWDAAHAWFLLIIYCFLHIPYAVMYVDALLVYFTRRQRLLYCLFYMLCCTRPTKIVRIPARCNSKLSSIKCSSAKQSYCRCYMSLLDYFRFIIQVFFHTADILSTGLPE